MTDTDYEKQRHGDASQIIERLRQVAKDRSLELTNCVWNGSGPLAGRESRTLAVETRNSSTSMRFSDKQLADYPGRTGTEKTEAMLQELVRRLQER